MDAASALISFGISALANVTTEQVKKLIASRQIEWEPLKGLFIKSFFKSLDYHDKLYDDSAKEIIKVIRKAVKKDEDKLFDIFTRNMENTELFLSSLKTGGYQTTLTIEIVRDFSLDISGDTRLITGVLNDCFNFYRAAFFNSMSEKEGIQATFLECLKIENILGVLKKIDSQMVTRVEFDELKIVLYKNLFSQQPIIKKGLTDYDKYIRNKFRYIELRGFSPKVSGKEIRMELSDIFVPLDVAAGESIKSVNWEVNTGTLMENEKRIKGANNNHLKTEEIIRRVQESNLVILGDPGSGKSTLLKFLSVTVTRYRNKRHPFGCIVPVFFRVSEFADYLKKHGKSLYEFITEHFDKQYGGLFKEAFEYSNLLLFMDGLDEVVETSLRIRVTEQVEDLMARYPYNHYVVTSRIVGYQESRLGAGFKHIQLAPFGKDEIKIFSQQWYRTVAKNSDRDFDNAKVQANDLIDSISKNSSVFRLAANPLLMTIIALIHYRGKKLPNKRIELYDISTETFLEHWVHLRMQSRLSDTSRLKDKSEITEIMTPIAFEIHEMKSKGLIEESEFQAAFIRHFKGIHTSTSDSEAKKEYKEFKKFLRQEAGFFYEKGENDSGESLYGFIHLTFEEYFAAIDFVVRWEEGTLELEKYVFDPRWIEIIRLGASRIRFTGGGRAGRTKATKFVRDLLDVNDIFPESYHPLRLACLILTDDVSVTDELKNEIIDQVLNVLSKNEDRELVASFSRLFKDLLSSDNKEGFLERFKNELAVVTQNLILQRNLSHILLENSWEHSICRFLTDLLRRPSDNGEICKAIFSEGWKNYPIQSLPSFLESFRFYLVRLSKQQQDMDLIERLVINFLSLKVRGRFWSVAWVRKILDFEDVLDPFYDTRLFDSVLKIISTSLLFNVSSLGADKYGIAALLARYDKSSIAVNLSGLLKKLKINFNFLGKHITALDRYHRFSLPNFKGLIFLEGGEINIYHFCEDFTELKCEHLEVEGNVFSDDDIDNVVPEFLESLKSKFSRNNFDEVKWQLYGILGPQENHRKSVARFIAAYQAGKLYDDLFSWEDFPFKRISISPKALSKIIVEQGEKFLHKEFRLLPVKFKKDDFSHEDVCPPARLLAYYLLKEPYDQQLVLDSIDYYRSCPPEQKKGAFAILSKILNKLD